MQRKRQAEGTASSITYVTRQLYKCWVLLSEQLWLKAVRCSKGTEQVSRGSTTNQTFQVDGKIRMLFPVGMKKATNLKWIIMLESLGLLLTNTLTSIALLSYTAGPAREPDGAALVLTELRSCAQLSFTSPNLH